MIEQTPHTGPQRALIVVDVQNDFCEGGSLATQSGAAVASAIAEYVQQHGADYAAIVATADWHIDPGSHFSDSPDFVDSWPPHCVVGTPGADFHPAFAPALSRVEAIFRKGEHAAAYSGFEGSAAQGAGSVALTEWLRSRGITDVDVVGIATDYCVRATALDAVRAEFATRVLTDLTAGVAAESTRRALTELRDAGAVVTGSPAA